MRKMHDRNIYKVPPDFIKLAEQYEAFRKYVKISSDGKGHLNFKEPEAVRELTYTLLKHDFGLCLDIPLDRLIPTVPLRLNYILWIEDLLKESCLGKDQVRGVDIGCGASCIYPLLGAKLKDWSFIASETDDVSFMFAKKNIEMNGFVSYISLQKGNPDTLLKNVIDREEQYDFCMCNPPFFSDREEAVGANSRTDKRAMPNSVCTAADEESITDGGEVAFIKKMVEESIELKHSIRWYTSMLGKKKSLKTLNRYLTEQKIPFVTHTVFQQGKTTRWGIGWSFHKKAKSLKKLSPSRKVNGLPFVFVISKSEIERRYSEKELSSLGENSLVKLVFSEIENLLNKLEISYSGSSTFNDCGDFDYLCIGEAWKNTWSHQRQKRRLEKKLKVLEHGSHEGVSSDATSISEGCYVASIVDDCSEGTNNSVGSTSVDGYIEVEKNSVGSAGKAEVGGDLLHEESKCATVDSSQGKITGHKRIHSPIGQGGIEDCTIPMFKFKIKASANRGTGDTNIEPIRIEVSCLEGNREGLHQLFMFLRNQLNGIQRNQQKR